MLWRGEERKMSVELTFLRKDADKVDLLLRSLFVLSVFFIPFKLLADDIPFLARAFFAHTSFYSIYPLILFSVIVLVRQIKRGGVCSYKWIAVFAAVYICLKFVIAIHGLIIFPYWGEVDMSVEDGLKAMLYKILYNHMGIPSDLSIRLTVLIAQMKRDVSEFFCYYFVIFSVYLYYRDKVMALIKDIESGTCLALVVSFLYSIFELLHLFHFEVGTKVLAWVNPHLYEIAVFDGWWPPLFWAHVRNVFEEASFFGYWGAAALAILCHLFIRADKKWKKCLSFSFAYLAFNLYMANSRSATALMLGGFFGYAVVYLFLKRKLFDKDLLILFVSLVLMLFLSVVAMNYSGNSDGGINLSDYLESNVASIIKRDARSNNSRYGSAVAGLRVGFSHPILGVSEGLKGRYIYDNYPEWCKGNREISNWFKYEKEEYGILSSHRGSFNAFVDWFANGGIVGFLLEALPILFILFPLFMKTLRREGDGAFALAIALMAVFLAFGFSNNIVSVCAIPWLVLPFALVLAYPSKECLKSEDRG